MTLVTSLITYWAYQYVEYLARREFVKGKGTTLFAPNDPITRAEFITILARMSEEQKVTLIDYNQPQSFSDEQLIADYAKDFVSTMQKADIINGYPDGSFKPLANATRAESAKMLAFVHYLMNKS
ncbi:MAG: S-layer homology domain-containing protein [Clostridiales bacterium]|nr:S-layer homology domain-containing protein [Clostridiales bacterium]